MVAITAAQPPKAEIVYVTVYDPGILKLGFIKPVLPLIINPDVDE